MSVRLAGGGAAGGFEKVGDGEAWGNDFDLLAVFLRPIEKDIGTFGGYAVEILSFIVVVQQG